MSVVAPPESYLTSSKEEVPRESIDLLARISTPGRMHHAFTGTGCIALACAAQVVGSIPFQCMQGKRQKVRIGQPAGVARTLALRKVT